MPEEVNRVLTDRLSDLLFTHSPEAVDNLRAEGVVEGRIHHVGNTMIDSLRRSERAARLRRGLGGRRASKLGEYALVTLHRPSNVDDADQLARIVDALVEMAAPLPGRLPDPSAHPRAARRRRASPASRPPACAASTRSATSTSSRCSPAPARS